MTRGLELPSAAELTRELGTALQGALLESAPGAMSSDEALGVGQRVARGEGLPEEIAQRLGGKHACTLVFFDADRIQSWVFASERVQVGAGASKVLDNLNSAVRAGEIVGEPRPTHPRRGLQGVLYSAGGSGLLVADTHLDEKALEEQVRGWLEEKSHGLTFTVVARRLTAADLAASGAPRPLPGGDGSAGRFQVLDGFAGALGRLLVEVRRRKEETPRLENSAGFQPRPGEPLLRCPSCGRRPPVDPDSRGDGPDTWCGRCQGLRRFWKSLGGPQLERNERPLTFEDLAEASSRGRQYLAFLAVDGNSMGAVVQGVRTLLELRAFSEATTRIYQRARDQAAETLPAFLDKKKWTADEAHLSLLSGGDEITLVMPASAAPQVAVEVLRSIEEGFREATEPGALLAEAFAANPDGLARLRAAGAGAGLVAAQSSFPVRLLRRYAGELQKRAKRACAEPGGPRSGLGWLLLTDSSPLPEGTRSRGREELSVEALERRLEDVAAAVEVGLPRTALQRLIEQGRREEASIRTLGPGPARDEVVAPLAANFFRYQMARNRRLSDWWQAVAPDAEEGGEDPLLRWLREGGVERLERLAELLSLEPTTPQDEAPLEATA